MTFIRFLVSVIFYYFIIFICIRFLFKKVNPYKANFLLGLVNIFLTLFIINLSGLSWENAGFSFGNVKVGIIMIIISLFLIFLSIISIKKASDNELFKIPYIHTKNNKMLLLYVWLLVGPSEEFFYRGFFQGSLEILIQGSLLFLNYSTLISSLFFVIIHLFNVFMRQENFHQFLNLLPGRIIMSLILGFTFQISQSIIYPVIIHTLSDGITISYLIIKKNKLLSNYHS